MPLSWIKIRILTYFKKRKSKENINRTQQEAEKEENPYLPQLKEILDSILKKKKLSYEKMVLVVIDGYEIDNVLLAIRCIGSELNRLIVLTDRAAYFENISEKLYEEQGLIVEFFPKTIEKIAVLGEEETKGNLILDFETGSERQEEIKFGRKIYIPVFKRPWEDAGNLDITVPIGYNTVIVKNIKTVHKQRGEDKVEQAWYDKE